MTALTPSEERLHELLRDSGAVEERTLDQALTAFVAARAGGEEVSLGPWLVGQGLVSVSTVQDLLTGAAPVEAAALPSQSGEAPDRHEAGREGTATERPALPGGDAEQATGARDTGARDTGARDTGARDTGARDTGKRRRGGRSTGKRRARDEESERPRLRDPAESPARSTGKRRVRDEESERPRLRDPAQAAARKTAKRAVLEGGPAPSEGGSKGRRSGRRRKEGRSQRAEAKPAPKSPAQESDEDTHRFDVKSLAEASQGKSARLKSQRLEPTFGASATQEGTRRFDPDALAAASSRPMRRRPLLLPVLALGALSVVALGALSLMREEALPPPPPPGPEPSGVADLDSASEGLDPLGDVQEQARALEAREDYAGALALYRGLPPAVRAAEGEGLQAAEARLSELAMFARAAEQALSAAEPFRSAPPNDAQQAAQLQRVLAKLEGLVESATPSQLGSPAARRLQRALEELALSRTRPLDPEGPVRRREPAERSARFAELAKAGAAVVEQTRQRILTEKAQIEERRIAREARAQAESRRDPLTVVVDEIRHEGCVVGEFDERGFTLRAEGRTLGFRWREALRDHPQLALKVRQFAVRADSARDQLDFGRWCLEHRQWKEAQQAFSRAVVLDGRLKDRVPDVTAVARSSRVFRGKLERSAGSGSLTLRYDFRLAAHNADWTPAGNHARGGVRDGAYRIRGKGLAVTALKTVGWENHLSLHATVGAAQPGSMPLVGLTLRANAPGEESWLVGLDLGQMQVLLYRRAGKSMKVIERRELRANGEEDPILAVEVMGDRLLVRLDGRAMFLRSIPVPWGRTRLLLGVRSLTKGGPCQADFSRCQVVGAVRQEWIRKAFGEFDDHLRAFLARTEDLDVFARPEQKPPEPPLSCEDEFGLERVPAEARAHARRGQVKLGLGTPLDLLAAANAFAKAVELAPGYAAALYGRGLALERLGQRSLAVEEFERAARACPHFYEARAALARVLAGSERLTEAEAAARKALEERPDHAPARSALALVHFRRGDLERAREQLDLALALDPSDEGVRTFRRNVTNVLRGPPWETTYSTRTRNYEVKSDISQARADEYARELETIRSSYERFFQVSERGQAKRATVLIFDTEEGFQSYAELSTDDRVESLLGCYLRRYDQLLLYEDKDDATRAETRRVLYHEAFHQFLEPLIPDVPFWLSEGMAEYFGSTKIAEGKVVERGAKLPARLRDLRKFVSERGSPLPIPGLMRESPSEFYSGPVAVKYAQAWSIVHFLMHGASDELRARFARYLRALLAGKSPHEALAAWKGVDWKTFEAAWWAHVKGL